MLDHAFQRFPGQIETLKLGVPGLQLCHHTQGLGIVIKAAKIGHGFRQSVLARMPEGRMAEIVGERAGFGQILIHLQRPRQGPGDLGDFQRVGQARAIRIAFMGDKDLGLFLEPPEGAGMDDAVAVALEGAAHGALGLRVVTAAAVRRIAGIRGAHRGHLQLLCLLRSFFGRLERPYTDARPKRQTWKVKRP